MSQYHPDFHSNISDCSPHTSFRKQVALITGASRGIGRAIARELAAQNMAVCVNYHTSRAAAEELVLQIRNDGGTAIALAADVAQRSAVHTMLQIIHTELGPVTLLVNNAGISRQAQFQDIDDTLWEHILAVNLTGARNCIIETMPDMLAVKSGVIINIASIWSLRGASCETAYACSKAGLTALTKSLALELAPSGIRVNAVAPGCIATDMTLTLGSDTRAILEAQTPLGRLGQPEEIAQAVAFLASDKAKFITGQILTIDGGFIT